MKLKFRKQLLALLAVPVLGLCALAPILPASALSIADGANSAKGTGQSSCLFAGSDDSACAGETPIFQKITNVLLFAIGAVSVIMLIIGGFRYTVSQGDSTQMTSAKNTILYSIVGIVVALLAYALVNFVIGNFIAAP
ncbi:MAG: pilin [Candidatus Saccharimonas sp.]